MFYVMLDRSMNLVVTMKEPIYRGDNLNQKLHYLVPKKVGDIDMIDATIYLNLILPNGIANIIKLDRKAESYNESYFEYVLPVDLSLSRIAGDIRTWMHICQNLKDETAVAKSGECILHILESGNIDQSVGDQTITALQQIQSELNARIDCVDDALHTLEKTKADNITFNKEDSTIQLTANGIAIGDRILVASNSGSGIKNMNISEDGDLIVSFDNGVTQNLGRVVGADGGVYVPRIDSGKVLTFTFESSPAGSPPPVDLNPNNDWGDIGDDSGNTDYIWEPI